jgi:hypothetical protein
MADQINFNEINEVKIKEKLKEDFGWANDDFIEEAITTSAIMINSLILALDKGMQDEALVTYCKDILQMQERFADIKFEAAKQEREICAQICEEIYDQSLGNDCCKGLLKIAQNAISSRSMPT